VSRRTDAANLVNQILYNLGALSAIVPRGPLRDQVDDETEHMAALAEAIGQDMPYDPHPDDTAKV
jgi:hypothetical protein